MPSTSLPTEKSQGTLLRERVISKATVGLLSALPVPACTLSQVGAMPEDPLVGGFGPQVVLANQALERMLNYEPGALSGCMLSRIVVDRLPADWIVDGMEAQARRSDGAPVPVRLTIRGTSAESLMGGLLCTFEDMRLIKDLHSRMVAAEKLMAQGALVAGVAHEVNNPANLLLANVRELCRTLPSLLALHAEPGGRHKAMDEISAILLDTQEGAQRIVDVVRDLVQLSHAETMPAEPVDLNRLIEMVLRMARPILGSIQIQRSLGAIPVIRAQRPRLFQVLLNLLINAVHALADVEHSRRLISIHTRAAEVGERLGISLEVRDNGCGMTQAVLDRVYEPFFTTKLPGRGTGLGLALTRVILEQHGGTIHIDSSPGRGTSVSVWLPCDGPADAQGQQPPARAIWDAYRRY